MREDRRAAVEDGDLRTVGFDRGIVHAERQQCRKQMLDGRERVVAYADDRRAARVDNVFGQRRNVRAALAETKREARIGRRRMDANAGGGTRVQADSGEFRRLPQRLLQAGHSRRSNALTRSYNLPRPRIRTC